MVDVHGNVLADVVAGPANIRLSLKTAVESIETAFALALKKAKILKKDLKKYTFHAGIGLAGYEVLAARKAFLKEKLPFHAVRLSSDATVACLGAHGGENGSIVIAGTGVVGLKLRNKIKKQIGGWGFPHGDAGAGAWLGLEAIKYVLRLYDGLQKPTPFLLELKRTYGPKKEILTQWACNATATDYGSLTPIIMKHVNKKDPVALDLIHQAAKYIEEILSLFVDDQKGKKQTPCCLIGGMAPLLKPYLKKSICNKLTDPLHDACQGAIFLISQKKKI